MLYMFTCVPHKCFNGQIQYNMQKDKVRKVFKQAKTKEDIFKAAETGNLEDVILCVSEGTDINSTDSEGRTALYIGCLYNRVNVVEYLLHKGVDTEVRDNVHQKTAVIVAAENEHSDIVRLLVNHKVNIDTQDKSGRTALWVVSFDGHADTVDILLANQANPNIRRNEQQATALHVACQNNHTEVVRLLLKHSAEVDMKGRGGETGLYIAAHKGHEQTVAALLQHGADVNVCSNDRATPLYVAAHEGHAVVVEMLLNHGANIDSKNICGDTPLTVAAFKKHTTLVEILCQRGADINAVDNDGYTALHGAVQEDGPDTVRVLLKYKPELICNKAGESALDIANNKQYEDLIVLLEDYSKSRQKSPDVSPAKPAERLTSSVKEYLDSLQSVLKDQKNLMQAHGGAGDVTKINDYEVILCKMLRRAELAEEAPEGAAAAATSGNETDSPLWKEARKVAGEIRRLPMLGNDEKDFGNSHMFAIAKKVGDQWKQLGGSLGVNYQEVDRIADKYTDATYAAYVMLVQWRDGIDISMDEKRQMLHKAVNILERPDVKELI